MELKRLIIRNFGEIKELDFVPEDAFNYVSETVANAISYVLNNQFAIRHYNKVDLRADTYLYGEIHRYQKGKKIVYGVEINGFDNPIFTKDGIRLTDDEVDSDQALTRPYREDNTCIFAPNSKTKFLDHENFLPVYFRKLSGYADVCKELIENRYVNCNIFKRLFVKIEFGKVLVYRDFGYAFKVYDILTESDRYTAIYTVFLLFVEMIDYYNQFITGKGTERTPIVVEGLLSHVDQISIGYLLERTMGCGRQTFFVEKNPKVFKNFMK